MGQSAPQFDFAIVGGGMVGACAAALLASDGHRVALLEQAEPMAFAPAQPLDVRVSALSVASVRLLEQAGAWGRILAMRALPYTGLETWEWPGLGVRFDAAELGLSELGYFVENRLVQLGLWQSLDQMPSVTRFCPAQLAALAQSEEGVTLSLADGQQLQARWLLGADGAHSQVRRLAQIGISQFDYRQACLLATVKLHEAVEPVTWQQFTPAGPRALLPLPEDHASLVWYDTPERIAELAALSVDGLAAQIRAHFPDRLPAFTLQRWGQFPLSRRHALQYGAGRVLLLGDAAHTIHPLAGQGVNLGFKDVACLCQLVQQLGPDGEDTLLARYQAARRRDVTLMQSAMDLFYLGFSNELAPLKLLRNLGLLAAQHGGPAKRRALRYALGL
ncbi:FAD-dependent monooxygenase [Pseudaeromonas paramecii]|uniref:FAD-dependent monooxygenase n=1 Tax=Pseudaeromonas paramecii TaxID=2138166 RepID=A0ABP8QB61_9GAMM